MIDIETRVLKANPVSRDDQLEQLFDDDVDVRLRRAIDTKKEGRMTDPTGQKRPQSGVRRSGVLIAVALGVIVIVLNAVFAGLTDTDPATDPATSTTLPPPSPSLSNGWVAFAVEPGGDQGDIWLVKEDAEPRPLIGSPGDDVTQTCPRFSPDGTMLAYSEADWRQPETPWPTVLRSDGDGEPYGVSSVVVVTVDEAGVVEPMIRIPAPESEPPLSQVAAGPGYGAVCPKWSPDGQFIAFEAANQADGLRVVDLDGGAMTLRGTWMVAPTSPSGDFWLHFGIMHFEWAPDSSHIAVATDSGLWLVPLDGADPLLINGEHLFKSLSWSPNGDQLAVSFSRQASPTRDEVGRVMIGSGSEVVDVRPGREAIWAPNGSSIAYVAPAGGTSLTWDDPVEVRILDPSSGEEAELSTFPDRKYGLVWSPDSRQLVFLNLTSGQAGFRMGSVSIDGQNPPVNLVGPTEDLYDTSWPGEDISWQSINR